MSSRSWAKVEVETAEAREQREALAANGRWNEACAYSKMLDSRRGSAAEEWGASIPAPRLLGLPEKANAATTSDYARRVEQANSEFERELDAQIRTRRAARSREQRAQLRASTPATTIEDDRATNVSARIDAILDAAVAESADISTLHSHVEAVTEATGDQVELELAHLESATRRLRKERKQESWLAATLADQSREVARLGGLLAAIAPDESDLSAEIAVAASELRAGRPLDDDKLVAISESLEQERLAEICRINQRELNRVLFDVLAERGLEPVTGMETMVVEDGHLVTRSSWRGQHAVQVSTAHGDIAIEAVRVGNDATSPNEIARDAQVERELCDDVPAIFESLTSRGIRVEGDRTIPPGIARLGRVGNAKPGTVARATRAEREAEGSR